MSSVEAKVREGRIEAFVKEVVGVRGWGIVTAREAVEDIAGSGLKQGTEVEKPQKVCWVQ